MTTLSIVTRCMCRKSFLDQTLPTWIKLKEPQEIIIVDWGMTEDLTDLLLLDPRITILQIPNRQFFNAGASLNIGVDYAGSDIIFHIDSDIKITLFGLSRISETFSKNFFNADMIQTRDRKSVV